MWYWLRDLLVPQGLTCGSATRSISRRSPDTQVKTDAVDAATLAQLLRVQRIPEAHMISDAHREIRDVLRARLLLVTRTLQAARGRPRRQVTSR